MPESTIGSNNDPDDGTVQRLMGRVREKLLPDGPEVDVSSIVAYIDDERRDASQPPVLGPKDRETIKHLIHTYRAWFDEYWDLVTCLTTNDLLEATHKSSFRPRASESRDQPSSNELSATAIPASQSSPFDKTASRFPSWHFIGLCAVSLLLVFFSIFEYFSAAAAQNNEALALQANAGLKSQNDILRPAKQLVDMAKPSDGPLHSITFLPGGLGEPVDAPGKVKVFVRNGVFPCTLVWNVDGKEETVTVPLTGAEAELPSGTVRFWCEPVYGRAWFQPFGIVRNKDYLGGTVGPIVLKLKDKEKIVVHLDQPYPPWNAVMVPIKGRWTMVTIVRPGVQYDLAKYRAGEWKGSEELPNTMLFWAKYGSKGLAEELAKYFVDRKNKKDIGGNFRGSRHTAFVVPFDKDGVVPELRTLSAEELVPILTDAFEMLLRQRSPGGIAFQDDLDKAKEIVKTLKERKP